MISNRCLYALKATLELSLRANQGPVTIGQIAETQSIPVRFLEAILRQLKQGGLAKSVRGKDGGYYLALEPHKISIGQVIRLFEGPLVSVSKNEDGEQVDDIPDVFSPIWKKAEKALSSVYDEIDFGTLADQQVSRSEIQATNFTI